VVSKGSRVGLKGVTGSGKSTLLDILMGLLHPTEGEVLMDGVPLDLKNMESWRRRVSHVSQVVFLPDSTVAESIGLGVPREKLDMNWVREAAERAQLRSTIEDWVDGFETRVGERGVCLSGGQRQRIGIARAFYKRADVLVLDEATSALDYETENAVMRALNASARDITIFLSSHRLETLRCCDSIIDLGDYSTKVSITS
jgi:ATP-binding cassette subfamily B protein